MLRHARRWRNGRPATHCRSHLLQVLPLSLRIIIGWLLFFGLTLNGGAQTLRVPFDFSQSEIAFEATVNGEPFYVLLDTGVDPSAVDLKSAEALHLKIDRANVSEVSGFGNTEHPTAFPATITGMSFAGHKFASFDALTADFSGLSAKYGRHLDAFLGYSFLQDKIVLIDYPQHMLYLLDEPSAVSSLTKSCRKKSSSRLQLLEGENWPLIPQLRLGDAVISATLDTGSSGLLTLYSGALEKPGVRSAMVRKGEVKSGGFLGEEKFGEYTFTKPIGFADFELPSGSVVSLRNAKGAAKVDANVGNKLLAAMNLKLMLDYRNHTIAFYGDCGDR